VRHRTDCCEVLLGRPGRVNRTAWRGLRLIGAGRGRTALSVSIVGQAKLRARGSTSVSARYPARIRSDCGSERYRVLPTANSGGALRWTAGAAFRGKITDHSMKTVGKNAASKTLDQSSASLPGCPPRVNGTNTWTVRVTVNTIANG